MAASTNSRAGDIQAQTNNVVEFEVCAICLERPKGVILRPCGHDYFCQDCVQHLFTCPLCRAPVLRDDNGQVQTAAEPPTREQEAREQELVVASRSVFTQKEKIMVQVVCLGVWFFIFVFGIVEHMHDLHQSCDPGDPIMGSGEAPPWLSVERNYRTCKTCSPKNHIDCDMCVEGHYNLGTQCFKYLENLPPIKTGAALGGTIYFILIVSTQCTGIATEIIMIRRLLKRKLMPRKELVILILAIFIELCRMFLVDIFVMQEYFGGRAYRIFREPVTCADVPSNAEYNVTPWPGADGRIYCDDITPHSAATRYYVASEKEAWSLDEMVCSTFTTSSQLLAFDERGLQDIPGHTRFKTMGWVIGGEFALYYFFATFINELADNMFVIPTTTSHGWYFKVFSVALEVFQLGALCPAAVFTHKDCLHFTAPLNVPLKTMSTIVILFGYFIWSFIFMSIPLAMAGGVMVGGLFVLISAASALGPVLQWLAGTWFCQHQRCRGAHALEELAQRLQRLKTCMQQMLEKCTKQLGQGFMGAKNVIMLLAFIPMLAGGIFLGTLVVVGQASKQGAMHVLTAIVLLSDVLFKVFATLTTEVADYLLHLRVRRRVNQGPGRMMQGQTIGCSLGVITGSISNDNDVKGKGCCEEGSNKLSSAQKT